MFKFPATIAFSLVAAAFLHAATNTTQIQYLSGTDKDHTVPWQFYMTGGGRSNNVLTTIPVPSCWQTKGFGNYGYGVGTDSGSVSQSMSVGQYGTTFSVPASWAGERIYLVYEGVLTDTATIINGQTIAGNITNITIIPPNTNGLPNDRAFDNSASSSPGGTGGIAVSPSGNVNLGTLNQFTLTAWVKPQEVISSGFPRIIMVGATPGYDTSVANGTAFLLNNGSGFQLTVNTAATNTPSGALTGTGWYFVAVTYDSTSGNANFYVGSQTSTPVLFSTQTFSPNPGPVAFGANAYAYLMNRSTLDRAFDGLGDDFRIFTNVLNQSALELVRSNALSTAAPPSAVAQYQWNFDGAVTGTTVTPALGTGGVLNFTNSAGAAANLYSAVGLGVSGGTNTATTNTTVTTTSHQGGFYEFSYDVTTNVVVGANTNVLNVTVNEWSANTSVNQAEREGDYWNFSGIFRPVYLMAKPQSNIQRMAVDAQASGLINANVYLCGITNNCLVVGSVTDTNNVQLGSSFTNTVTAGMTNVLLSAMLPSPQLWSAEFPNLYTLTVQLLDTNYNVIHTVTNLIGFRTIVFSNNVGYFVNGTKVVLRGICRHEFWPTDGRTTSLAESDEDIGLIKGMNMNAVRMSHYPPNKIFLDECDRLGLYVFDELAGWQHAYDNTIAPEVVKEMVIRDVNHPSIIAWDNGNEGGWNTTVDNNGSGATNVYAIWDPQNRHTQRPLSTFNNVQDDHYPSFGTFTNSLGAGKTAFDCTEILHGLYDGGGGASLSDYWNLMRTATNGIGMFTWAFLDEGVVRNDLAGNPVDVLDQDAPDGMVGPYRQPEASYYTLKATYNPAQVTPPNPAGFNGTLAIENRFSFTSLNQCTFDWQLGMFPDPTDPADASTNALTGGFFVALDGGSFAGPNVAPGASGSLVLPGFPANGTNYDALRLTATDPFGNNLYTWTWPLNPPSQIRDRIVGTGSAGAPAISAGTNASEIIVTNGPRIFHFSKTTGMINSLTVSNQAVSFTNGPVLVAGSWNVTSITNYSDGTNYVIMANNINTSTNAFQWTLRPDGWLKLVYLYTLTGSQNFMGITFNYPSNKVTGMNWLGQGPYRVYKNRTAGQEIFVHAKAYNHTWTGQGTLVAPTTTPWIYPEFEGYHGQLNWVTLQTSEQPITIVTPTTNLYFRVFTPPATDNGNVNPAYPAGAISLLHGIAPQGEKFNSMGTAYGPSSMQNNAAGLYGGEADLFFGPPPVATPVGPATNFTLNYGGPPIVQPPGSDWNTTTNWNPGGQGASASALFNPGSTFELVTGSRLRTPTTAGLQVFPGDQLTVDGSGVFENDTANPTNVSELRFKNAAAAPTNYFSNLVLNGGQLDQGVNTLEVIQGTMTVSNNSAIYVDNGATSQDRGYQIDSWLTGAGNLFWHQWSGALGGLDLLVTGTTNTFSGQWIVDQGALVGVGVNSLGTNNIIVGTNGLNAAIETLYDINNTNASLILGASGKMFLHQNDHFASVIINGTPLANGTYPFAMLNSTYPTKFPASWTQQNGSAFNTGSGQIIVGNAPSPIPQISKISLTGTTLSLSVTNGTAGGLWTLLQSTNVALPLSQWQTNTTGTFDGSGNLSTNLPNTATNRQEFYILKVQ